ncbi:MAG: tRNA uridine-5-carboxymethylaminomethyl(34) synthesis enzyme MnmG, partial [Bacteroidota bacterium]|nr:tRNA uridine-5-carboxymethylaminomethyl(34) synthesis enzyme MnmG [Bacteroidota bacterium]
ELIINLINTEKIEPALVNGYLQEASSSLIENKTRLSQLVLRPNIDLKDITDCLPQIKNLIDGFSPEAVQQAEIQVKYQVYLEKEEEMVKKMSALEDQIIPDNFNYDKIVSLSNESRQKFTKIKPRTLGQASRISGVNPSDVQILMVYMGR